MTTVVEKSIAPAVWDCLKLIAGLSFFFQDSPELQYGCIDLTINYNIRTFRAFEIKNISLPLDYRANRMSK